MTARCCGKSQTFGRNSTMVNENLVWSYTARHFIQDSTVINSKLSFFPYGNGSGEGTHLSLYIRLLPGEHDALLKWPFEGEITLTLLDQSRESRSKRNINQSFSPDPSWKSFQRPSKNSGALGFGYPQFVSHRGIESSGYVKENCLFIKAVIDGKYAIDL